MVGILLSFWEGLFPEAMLVSARALEKRVTNETHDTWSIHPCTMDTGCKTRGQESGPMVPDHDSSSSHDLKPNHSHQGLLCSCPKTWFKHGLNMVETKKYGQQKTDELIHILKGPVFRLVASGGSPHSPTCLAAPPQNEAVVSVTIDISWEIRAISFRVEVHWYINMWQGPFGIMWTTYLSTPAMSICMS